MWKFISDVVHVFGGIRWCWPRVFTHVQCVLVQVEAIKLATNVRVRHVTEQAGIADMQNNPFADFFWALIYQSFSGVSYGLIYHAKAFSDARPMGVIKAINFDTNVGLDMLLDMLS